MRIALSFAFVSAAAIAQDGAAAPALPEPPSKLLAKYSPAEGTVAVGTQARVALPPGWAFLDGPNARRWLRELGNRPGDDVLGVALPPDFGESHVFAVYSYVDDGHVHDDDVPDFDALLAQMKEGVAGESEERRKAGMPGVKLLGWAEPPHYDAAQHKLYWAEKLQFDENDGLTLNYNVRVLGRTGHLVVNGVGDVDQLATVAAHNQVLLGATEFVEGKRYENFDPAYDKVAAYGIGGLVAGKLALKVGLFAKLALLLKAFLKPILIGVAVLGGVVWKAVGGRRRRAAESARAG